MDIYHLAIKIKRLSCFQRVTGYDSFCKISNLLFLFFAITVTSCIACNTFKPMKKFDSSMMNTEELREAELYANSYANGEGQAIIKIIEAYKYFVVSDLTMHGHRIDIDFLNNGKEQFIMLPFVVVENPKIPVGSTKRDCQLIEIYQDFHTIPRSIYSMPDNHLLVFPSNGFYVKKIPGGEKYRLAFTLPETMKEITCIDYSPYLFGVKSGDTYKMVREITYSKKVFVDQ